MTGAKRKKTITIQTIQQTVIRPISNQTTTKQCEFCQAEVEMAPPELAAKFLQISVREIYRRIESGSLHFIETESGTVFICQNSLGLTKKEKKQWDL